MPGEPPPNNSREQIAGLPLYLVGPTIGSEIRKKGRTIAQIHVVREGCHWYRVTVETYTGTAEPALREDP